MKLSRKIEQNLKFQLIWKNTVDIRCHWNVFIDNTVLRNQTCTFIYPFRFETDL